MSDIDKQAQENEVKLFKQYLFNVTVAVLLSVIYGNVIHDKS